MTEKLLPCPFCGGTPILELFNDGFFDYARIRCCRVMFDWCGDETGEQAIAAWNRRADAVPVVRGKWTHGINENFRTCSACNISMGLTEGENLSRFKYCPFCGAKMEVEP